MKTTGSSKIKRRIILAAVLALAVLIYLFSRQSKVMSLDTSSRVTRFLLRLLRPGYGQMSPERQQELVWAWVDPVRKAAHFLEYTLFGVLLFGYLRQVDRFRPFRRSVPLAWIAAVLYACMDEIHQKFVSGRGPTLTDVLIDAAGAAIGIALCVLWIRQRQKRLRPADENITKAA